MAPATTIKRLLLMVVVALYCMVGCGRIGFDLLALPRGDGGGSDGGGTDSGARADASAADGSTADTSGLDADASIRTDGAGDGVPDAGGQQDRPMGQGGSAGSGIDASGSGGGNGAGGTGGVGTGVGGAAGAADAGVDTGPVSGCAGGPVPVQTWSFTTDVQSWTFFSGMTSSGTVGWTGATGNPDPGAIQFDATSGSGTIGDILYSSSTAINLSGRTLSAWVMLATTKSVTVNFIAATTLTSTGYGPSVPLTPGTWICVSFRPDSPTSALAGYDPSQIRYIGLQPVGSSPFRLYVDQVRY